MIKHLASVIAFVFVLGAVSPAQIRVIDRATKKPSAPVPLAQRGLLGHNFAFGKHTPRKIGPYLPGQGLQLPRWTTSFNYQGTVYSTTVVGTDPALGQTTTIPTVIIPYKLIFADGTVLDATQDNIDGITPINGILNSPIFQNIAWNSGPTQLGTTQWGDAVLRANYWGRHSDQGQGYHVRLSTPAVLPVVTIQVPANLGFTAVDGFNHRFGVVDVAWLTNLIENEIGAFGIRSDTLPIQLFSYVVSVELNGGSLLGFHWAFNTSSDPSAPVLQTSIQAGYFPVNSIVQPAAANTGVLGHEVAEWLKDPSLDNFVPAWQDPVVPHICDSPLQEVGDPLAIASPGFPVSSGGRSYTFPDIAFDPWFSRMQNSVSANGWFSLLNTFSSYSQACPVFTNFGVVPFDFIGVDATVLTSINNTQQAVGYVTVGNGLESFVLGNLNVIQGSQITVNEVSVPGSLLTVASGINDAGNIVGVYVDASAVAHGFLFSNGSYSSIDFPGAASTEANGINNKGEIVGDYTDAHGIIHAFLLSGKNYSTIAVPSAVNAVAYTINDKEKIAGSYDTGRGVTSGFVGTIGAVSPLSFPNSPGLETTATQLTGLNDLDQIIGISTRSIPGFAEVHGFLEGGGNFEPLSFGFDGDFFSQMFGINNSGIAVGTFADLTGQHGIIIVPTMLFSNIPNGAIRLAWK